MMSGVSGAMVAEAVERYHRLDILWNNAAATKLCNEQDRPGTGRDEAPHHHQGRNIELHRCDPRQTPLLRATFVHRRTATRVLGLRPLRSKLLRGFD